MADGHALYEELCHELHHLNERHKEVVAQIQQLREDYSESSSRLTAQLAQVFRSRQEIGSRIIAQTKIDLAEPSPPRASTVSSARDGSDGDLVDANSGASMDNTHTYETIEQRSPSHDTEMQDEQGPSDDILPTAEAEPATNASPSPPWAPTTPTASLCNGTDGTDSRQQSPAHTQRRSLRQSGLPTIPDDDVHPEASLQYRTTTRSTEGYYSLTGFPSVVRLKSRQGNVYDLHCPGCHGNLNKDGLFVKGIGGFRTHIRQEHPEQYRTTGLSQSDLVRLCCRRVVAAEDVGKLKHFDEVMATEGAEGMNEWVVKEAPLKRGPWKDGEPLVPGGAEKM
ncbi:Acetolactate synthase small subunit, mitochondrial [Sphaceloma murrayae]|uniref:Acetolactate synthase small subunit, mitochondrial n=1 Tax=Sphaceloma murrayae TaxID=2082308 RepID=A0A2K1QN32_9PEZI|nr:Acetolactate synthase small subunit, mitochondrial [Sphaceloma murrayae]